MSRLQHKYAQQGFYGIGLVHCQNEVNIGTLWRSAFILGASFIFTVGKQYKMQGSDVTQSWTKIPLFHYKDFDDLYQNLPYDTQLIGVELDAVAKPLATYEHPARAVYLLGSEQTGLSPKIISRCHALVKLPGEFSLNVAVTGSLIMYDRISKIPHTLPQRA